MVHDAVDDRCGEFVVREDRAPFTELDVRGEYDAPSFVAARDDLVEQARPVDDKSASATARAEYEIFKDIPPAARVDRTWDNGTEASLHMLVDEALGMLTYFADPYSSWQRGSNENRNGRIRRYLPKGTGFEDLAQEDLDAIVGEINDTP